MGYCCDICKKDVVGKNDSATVWIGVIDGIVEGIKDKGITQSQLDTIQSRLVCDDCMGGEVSHISFGTRQFKVKDYFVNLLKNTGFIKNEESVGNPYTESRFGKFSVSESVYVDGLDVSCLFKNMIIIEVNRSFNEKTIEYTACSHMFDIVDSGVMVPRYGLSILIEKGNKILVVKKLDGVKGREKTYVEKRIDAITGGVDLSTGRRFNV